MNTSLDKGEPPLLWKKLHPTILGEFDRWETQLISRFLSNNISAFIKVLVCVSSGYKA